MRSRGPEHFDFCSLGAAQAEMQAFVVSGFITPGGRCEARLPVDLHACSQTVAVAASTAQSDGQPVSASAAIEKDLRMRAEHGGHSINPAIIVKIAESCSPARNQRIASRIDSLDPSIVI